MLSLLPIEGFLPLTAALNRRGNRADNPVAAKRGLTSNSTPHREGLSATIVQAACVRPCIADDLPAIAALFRRTFRHDYGGEPAPLEPYLRRILFDHPWQGAESRSLVYVGTDGRIGGFAGVLPQRLIVDDQKVDAAVMSTLMVERPGENPTAGARLVKAAFSGQQEISFSESANATSRAMWLKLGSRVLPAFGMEWLRVLRPVGLGVAFLESRSKVARLLTPASVLVDPVARRLAGSAFRPSQTSMPGIADSDVTEDEAIDLILELSRGYAIRPDWDRKSLSWFLDNAAVKDRYGRLFRRVVKGRDGAPIGCYLYYCRPRGVAFVLQMLARDHAREAVVESLVAHADGQGAVALRGRVQPEFSDALLRKRAVFLHVSSALAYTKNQELTARLRSEDALLTGLAAESWSQLIGGTFT